MEAESVKIHFDRVSFGLLLAVFKAWFFRKGLRINNPDYKFSWTITHPN